MMCRFLVATGLVVSLAACSNAPEAPPPSTPPAADTMSTPPPPPEFTPIPAPADVAAAPTTAGRTASGLAFTILTPGDGKGRPNAESMVLVHYTGWSTDGKMFDSSVARGKPAAFGLYQVIPGWTEGLQLMSRGEKRRFWIPGGLAYDGMPGRPQGTLVFDVELLDFR